MDKFQFKDNVDFNNFFTDFHNKTNRGYAWIDLNSAFLERENKNHDDEYLAKELYIFLANWGMIARGAFLMEHNYRILVPVVQIITQPKYKILQNPEIDVVENNIPLILSLKKEINDVLKEYSSNKKSTITKALNSKIIMGTLGCCIAYDTYVCDELKNREISYSFCTKSMEDLCELYKKSNIELLRKKYVMPNGKLYPPMKFLDLLLWKAKIPNS